MPSTKRQPVHCSSAAQFYVSSAAATIFGASRRARAGGLWGMLSAYLDESGTHKGSRICAIGCLLASPLQWERLTCSWKKVLGEVGLTDFHAADCANGAQAFKEWGAEDR